MTALQQIDRLIINVVQGIGVENSEGRDIDGGTFCKVQGLRSQITLGLAITRREGGQFIK